MEYLQELQFTHEYWVILAPCILMLLDVITGYYNAWKNGTPKSSKMRDGLGKKMAELCYIIIAFVFGLAFDIKAVAYFVSLYVIYMESLSIVENCEKLGFPMPDKWRDKLNNTDDIDNSKEE